MDPLPARELFASSRVLGTLQRECMDVARRVHELLEVGPPEGQLVDQLTGDRRASRADQVVRAVRRRSSAAGLSPTRRSSSAGLARRSSVERGGSPSRAPRASTEASYGGATLVPRLEDERRAEQIGDVMLDWTERALAAVLEAYHGIASVAHGLRGGELDKQERRTAELAQLKREQEQLP